MTKRKHVQPKIWCGYDHCCEFEPASHNARYCSTHKCKRKAENAAKRITAPLTNPEELWAMQEGRKLSVLTTAQKKNQWLLDKSRIGFFDIETSNLDANIGMMLCACVKDYKGGTKTFIMSKDNGLYSDRKFAVAMRDYLEKFDYVVTWYGTKFDVPYLNTRLILHGERPLDIIRHIDLYYTARFKLKLHSNRLAVVSESLFGESDKTRVVGPIWTNALMGDKKALQYIIDHCVIDVDVLEQVFEELHGFVNLSAKRWRKFGGSY